MKQESYITIRARNYNKVLFNNRLNQRMSNKLKEINRFIKERKELVKFKTTIINNKFKTRKINNN